MFEKPYWMFSKCKNLKNSTVHAFAVVYFISEKKKKKAFSDKIFSFTKLKCSHIKKFSWIKHFNQKNVSPQNVPTTSKLSNIFPCTWEALSSGISSCVEHHCSTQSSTFALENSPYSTPKLAHLRAVCYLHVVFHYVAQALHCLVNLCN